MIRAKVNDAQQFDLQVRDKTVQVNDQSFDLDAVRVDQGALHLILKNRSYRIRLESRDRESKTYRILVNGHPYQVSLSDEMDLLLNKLGLSGLAAKKVNEVKAPMPGLVLKVEVESGQEVEKGQSLLVLEAMKMENVIKSPGPGKVKGLRVAPGDKVEKNAVLVEFE